MANGSAVPNPNDPVQVVKAWLSNLFGEDVPEEKDSSARIDDTVAAQQLYKNPYRDSDSGHSIDAKPKAAVKPKSNGIATRLPSKTILGETRSPTMAVQPNDPGSGPSTPYLRIPTKDDQMALGAPSVESEMTTPGLYYPGAQGRFLQGPPALVPYGKPLESNEVETPKGNEQKTDDLETENPDIKSYMDQLRSTAGKDVEADIDWSPFIAWADSLSGRNVLKGYNRPKTGDELRKEREDLVAKLAAISERREYHKGSLAKDEAKRKYLAAFAESWNKENPNNLINPLTGTAFKSGDDWMNTIGKAYALEGIKGGAAKEKQSQAEAYILEWKKQNPGKKPEPYWDGNSIAWTKEPRPPSSKSGKDKPIYPSTAELNSAAEGTFASWYKRSYNKRDPKDRDILATIKSVYTKALEDAKKDKANYYELAEKRLSEFLAENKRKNAEAKAKEQKPAEKGWMDSLGDKLKEMGL